MGLEPAQIAPQEIGAKRREDLGMRVRRVIGALLQAAEDGLGQSDPAALGHAFGIGPRQEGGELLLPRAAAEGRARRADARLPSMTERKLASRSRATRASAASGRTRRGRGAGDSIDGLHGLSLLLLRASFCGTAVNSG
jgi:hypothetical protein